MQIRDQCEKSGIILKCMNFSMIGKKSSFGHFENEKNIRLYGNNYYFPIKKYLRKIESESEHWFDFIVCIRVCADKVVCFQFEITCAVCSNSVIPASLKDFTPFFHRKNTSASWKIVVIVWFFGHKILNYLLLFNQAMKEIQYKMKSITD
jgi:hypothetical protein